MSRARVLRSVLTLVAALIALPACGLPAHQRTVQAPQAGPALTLDAAKRVLASYEAGNNTANARRSADLLARYETDTMLALDIASYRIEARLAPTKTYVPFYYAAPTFYLPRLLGYPRWFVVQSSTSPDPGRHAKPGSPSLQVFSKRSAAEPWLVTLAPHPARDTRLPAVEVDGQGYATAVPGSAALALRPENLAKAHADLLSRGPAAPSNAQFAADPTTAAYRADDAKQARELKGLARASIAYFPPAEQQVFALRTTDGGALAFYAVEGSLVATALPGSLATLNPLGDDLALIGPGDYNVLSQVSDLQFTVAIPRTGKVRVLGHYTGLASVHGE